jgi:hypothetical protein
VLRAPTLSGFGIVLLTAIDNGLRGAVIGFATGSVFFFVLYATRSLKSYLGHRLHA